MQPRVAVVSVAWNCRPFIQRLLAALRTSTLAPAAIVVVDNHSDDGVAEMIAAEFPEATVARMTENLGGSGGFFRGLATLDPAAFDYVWLLDGDAYPEPEALIELVRIAQTDSSVGIVGSQIVRASDRTTIQEVGCHFSWPSGINTLLHSAGENKDPGQPSRDVDYVAACSLLFPIGLTDTAGFMRPEFFVFMDDIEWCFRVRALGFRVVTAPRSIVYHEYGEKRSSAWRLYYGTRNNFYFLADYAPWWTLGYATLRLYIITNLFRRKLERAGHGTLSLAVHNARRDFGSGIMGRRDQAPALLFDSVIDPTAVRLADSELAGRTIVAWLPIDMELPLVQIERARALSPSPRWIFVIPATSRYRFATNAIDGVTFIERQSPDRYEGRTAAHIRSLYGAADFAVVLMELETDINTLAPRLLFIANGAWYECLKPELRPSSAVTRVLLKLLEGLRGFALLLKHRVLRRRRSARWYALRSRDELAAARAQATASTRG